MRDARDRWWIIAGAAVTLHGIEAEKIGDVDVLASCDDARRFADRVGIALAPGKPSDRFRSALFGRWTDPPLTVEIMADFAIATPAGWHIVKPLGRHAIHIETATVYVPGRNELSAMLRMFGRPKDVVRADLLQSGPS